jgi:MFS family permease|tara:strand:- start:6701 stop:8071 length:1371 start_codon:yes stop_codon:yes gene_type:complete
VDLDDESSLRPKKENTPSGLWLTPFARLGRTHAFGTMSDAMIAVALAGSVFFSVDPSAARWRVALYLVLTIAPFAVVTPLIGPLIDRISGGRRRMILFTTIGRGVLAWLMTRHIDSLLLFPEAFGFLVLGKSYSVAKSAVLPELVRSDLGLVESNAKLSVVGALSSMAGAAIGGLALLGGDAWPAWVAVFGFGITTLYALQVPKTVVAKKPASANEITELKTESIVYTAATMAFLRAAVGFVTFLLAFEFRGGDEGLSLSGIGEAAGVATGHLRNQDVFGTPGAPAWHFGVVMVAAGLGMLIGANLAPRMRKRFIEERIIFLALLLLFTGAITAAFALGVLAAVLISFVTTIAGGTAKLAFDSLVQRDAPDANHGRFFAKFEGRFQMSWAIGALIAALAPIHPHWGYAGLAGISSAALLWYHIATQESRRRATPTKSDRPDGQLPIWERENIDPDQ